MYCGICLNEVDIYITLNCTHHFCHSCIKQWYLKCNENRTYAENTECNYNNPCPNCRTLSTDETWDKVIND